MIRILIAEDEALVAAALAAEVEDAGAQALGPAETVAEAVRIARRDRPEGAILDVQLADGEVGEAARLLVAQGAVVLFHTASPTGGFETAPVIAKPADPARVAHRVLELIEARRARAIARGAAASQRSNL